MVKGWINCQECGIRYGSHLTVCPKCGDDRRFMALNNRQRLLNQFKDRRTLVVAGIMAVFLVVIISMI